MARIPIVTPEGARGPQQAIVAQLQSQYGVLPGIAQILLTDPEVMAPTFQLYQHLHLSPASALTRLQREMLATVVNGLVNGAP